MYQHSLKKERIREISVSDSHRIHIEFTNRSKLFLITVSIAARYSCALLLLVKSKS